MVAIWQIIYMVAISVIIAAVVRVLLGVLPLVTDKDQILQNSILNEILGAL